MGVKSGPRILFTYPSCFLYPRHMGWEQVKSSQLLLASYLSRHFPVEYVDLELEIGRPQSDVQIRRYQRQVRDFLGHRDFDILALSCWTSLSYRATMATARIARELYPDRLIVVGGYHATAVPDDFITADGIVDYIVRGEGELALTEIAQGFPAAGRPPRPRVVVAEPLQPGDFFIMNWDLVDNLVRSAYPEGLNTLCVYVARGCPFNCSFCMETLKNRRWRACTPSQAIDQITAAADRFRFIALGIGDACFGVNRNWRKEFLHRLVDLAPPYWVLMETRPEFLDKEDITLLGRIKSQVQLGVESCSPQILKIMNKSRRPEDFLARFREISHLMSEHGVVHGANLIFNHPGETHETLRETFAFMDAELTRGPATLIWTCHGYSHFPGSAVDLNRPFYEKTYGTEFHSPTWWRENEDQYTGGRRVVPSQDLKGDGLELWLTMLRDRDEQLKNALTPIAFRIAAETMFAEWRQDPRYQAAPAL